MSWLPAPKPLTEQLADKGRELHLARHDGACEWIQKVLGELDELLDQLPRTPQPAEQTS